MKVLENLYPWVSTPELRWFGTTLQQRWCRQKSIYGQFEYEWRPIPWINPADEKNGD